MIMKQKLCIFCRNSLQKSKEHVIPKWILKHLKIEKREIALPVFDKTTPALIPIDKCNPKEILKNMKSLERRKMTLNSLVEGRVCKTCNNGWMGKLEEKAKDILIPLMDSKRITAELGNEERFLIARWLFKTLVVLNSSSGYRQLFSEDQLSSYYEDVKSFPKGVAFFCQQHHGPEPFFWLQTQYWPIQNYEDQEIAEDNYIENMKNSFKISLQLGKLILLMCYWPPSPGWVFCISKGIHVPLWFWQRACTYYDCKIRFPWNNRIEAIGVLNCMLGISKRSTEEIFQFNNNRYAGSRKIGRNDFCWCGSGKKYKKCHGN